MEGTCNEELDIDEEMVGQFATEGFEEFYYPNNSGQFLKIIHSDAIFLLFIETEKLVKPLQIVDGLLKHKMIW